MQKERLDKKGLKLHESVVPSKGTSYGTGKVSRKSLWYTTDMMYENVSRKLSFENENGPVYERDTEMAMYEIVAHSPNEAQTQFIRVTSPKLWGSEFCLKIRGGVSILWHCVSDQRFVSKSDQSFLYKK